MFIRRRFGGGFSGSFRSSRSRRDRRRKPAGCSRRVDEPTSNSRPMALPVSRSRQAGAHRRFPVATRPRHRAGSVLPQSTAYERLPTPTHDHARRPPPEPPSTVVTAPGELALAIREGAHLQVSQQHRRAGPSGDQTTMFGDARLEGVRPDSRDDRRRRIGPPYSEATIQSGSSAGPAPSYDEDRLGSSAIRLLTHFDKSARSPRPRFPLRQHIRLERQSQFS